MDNQSLVTGQLSDEEWTKLGIAATALSQTDIRVDDNPSITVAEMNAKCRRIDNLGLVLIDYLQLMTSAGGPQRPSDNRVQIVSEISRALKIMAKELNVPVICLSPLSRANESRADKRPMLSTCVNPAPLSRTLTKSCSCTATTTTTKIPRRKTWPSASWPRTATARPAPSSSNGCPSTPLLPTGSGNMLTDKVWNWCRTQQLLAPGDAVTVALSGGVDSVALLHILLQLPLRVSAVHFNHHLRGAESDRDEAFCQELCAVWNVPLRCGGADVSALAQLWGTGVETAARKARYDFFGSSETIATAHHGDDNLETLLLHLTRGSALRGLAASRPGGTISSAPCCAPTAGKFSNILPRTIFPCGGQHQRRPPLRPQPAAAGRHSGPVP